MKIRRWAMSAISINNRIYIFGGKQLNSPHGLKDVNIYDPEVDDWFDSHPMPSNRSEAAVALV